MNFYHQNRTNIMTKQFFCLFSFFAVPICVQAQEAKQFVFNKNNVHLSGASYTAKIELKNSATPTVKISGEEFLPSTEIVSDSLLNVSSVVDISVGMERKKSFAFVQVPAFRKNAAGQIERLQKFTVNITETSIAKEKSSGEVSLSKTTSSSSVLADGGWQKLAVAQRGVYKVDYNFVKNTLGQTASISSASIRLFGNGGTMLYESNKVKRYDDLQENAIEMHDGGDGVFNTGDYFLFYANGPTEWVKDSARQLFNHRNNLYADSSYYFISFNNGIGKRIITIPSETSPNITVTSFNDYAVHEKDMVNLGLFGKTWWGETFGFSNGLSASQTFTFPIKSSNDSVYFAYHLAAAAIGDNNSSSFTATLNGKTVGIHSITGISGVDGEDPGRGFYNSGLTNAFGADALNFTFTYQKFVTTAKGYLDFVEVNTRRQLSFSSGTQLSFRDWRSVAPSSVANFQLGNANAEVKIWDVTNPLEPKRIDGSFSGSTFSFVRNASQLREYIAADNGFFAPGYAGIVPNQNLHGLDQVDYIIVAHPEFMNAANKLADFHRNNRGSKVAAVDVNQVYNEFGSGAKDISAIRDFAKMFYDRAGTDESKMPKHLLLLGQASFDYKNIIANNAKLVPTFETPESLNANSGYCTDDFFALLDDDEYIEEGLPLMDIGVGRIPATNAEQAMAIVDKIIRYKSNESLGPWRINNIFTADKEDNGGDHLMDADAMYKTVENTTNIYKAAKVYLDNMNIISTPGGPRCPDANKMINDNINKGTFLINYSGHGSIYTLSSKRIVTQDDYNSWNNMYKLPIMITATCDFSRFDNPALQSAGEKIILKSNGGAIALVTTTQVVYANPNKEFNTAYLHAQFTKTSNGWYSLGEAFRLSKNQVVKKGDNLNSRKFALLGDPALIPNFPRYDVQTDSVQEMVNGVAVNSDSVKSLGNYRIKGSVRNDDGNIMSDFNGKVNITFFDKAQTRAIQTDNSGGSYRQFDLQNNIIYKGIATVQNGLFSFDFITPKDINYEFGKGKISYYADNGQIDAAGADTTFTVGGFSDNVVADNDAPVVRPFMNDSLFKNGGLTGSNSVLYAIITDKSGINVSGNFVGHDLSAVLDNVEEAPYVLNDYYETAPNTYQRGFVNFPINNLTDGIHTLKVKAWDVFNNSGEGTVTFEVLNGKVLKMRNLYNYPNPFKDETHFVFEHNHPNEVLKATIHIFNTTGGLVRTLEQTFTPTGSNSAEVIWNGTGNGGEKLLPGVYPYRIRIATEKNIEDLGYQKVILVR